MGMFDTIHCEYPLPNTRHQDLEFQTKDLECILGYYTITQDGRLLLHAKGGKRELDRDIEWPLHGDLSFYTSIKDSGESVWVEYVARFTHGRVEWVRPQEEIPPLPDVPPLELDWKPITELLRNSKPKEEPQDSGNRDVATSAEEALLLSLRRERHELETLLERCSDHWATKIRSTVFIIRASRFTGCSSRPTRSSTS